MSKNVPPTDDGWIAWAGGNCPVDPDTIVTARTATHTFTGPAASFRWEHVEGWAGMPSTNLIAYRVVRP